MPQRLCGDEPAKSISDILVGDRHRHPDPDRLVEAVAQRLVGIHAIRQRANGLAHGPLGALDDRVGQQLNAFQPKLGHELKQRARANRVAGCLRVQVADGLIGGADIGANDRDQLLVRLAGDKQLGDRNAQPFLKHLARLGRRIRPPISGAWQVLAK